MPPFSSRPLSPMTSCADFRRIVDRRAGQTSFSNFPQRVKDSPVIIPDTQLSPCILLLLGSLPQLMTWSLNSVFSKNCAWHRLALRSGGQLCVYVIWQKRLAQILPSNIFFTYIPPRSIGGGGNQHFAAELEGSKYSTTEMTSTITGSKDTRQFPSSFFMQTISSSSRKSGTMIVGIRVTLPQ